MKLRTRAFNGLNGDAEGEGVRLDTGQRKRRGEDERASYQFGSITSRVGSFSDELLGSPKKEDERNSARQLPTDTDHDFPCGPSTRDSASKEGQETNKSNNTVRKLNKTISGRNLMRGNSFRKHLTKKHGIGDSIASKQDKIDEKASTGKNSRSLFGGLRKKESEGPISHIGEIKISKSELVSKAEKLRDDNDEPTDVPEKQDKSRNRFGGLLRRDGTNKADNHVGEVKGTTGKGECKSPRKSAPKRSVARHCSSDILHSPRKPSAPNEEYNNHIGEIKVSKKATETPNDPKSAPLEIINKEGQESHEKFLRQDGTEENQSGKADLSEVSNPTSLTSTTRRSFASVHEQKTTKFVDKLSGAKSMTSHNQSQARLVGIQGAETDDNVSEVDDDSCAEFPEHSDTSQCLREGDHLAAIRDENEISANQETEKSSKTENGSFGFFLDDEDPVVWKQVADVEGATRHLEMNIKFEAQPKVRSKPSRFRLGGFA